MAYIYSGFDRARLYSNGSHCPCLNDFIQTLKWYFIFISLVSSDDNFISKSVIVIDSCGVFANYIFFYVRLFPLMYVSPL